MAYPRFTRTKALTVPLFAASKTRWDVVRAIEVHPIGTSDEVHFKSAAEMGRLLVSNDQDMLKIAARWLRIAWNSRFDLLAPWQVPRVGEILRAFAATSVKRKSILAAVG